MIVAFLSVLVLYTTTHFTVLRQQRFAVEHPFAIDYSTYLIRCCRLFIACTVLMAALELIFVPVLLGGLLTMFPFLISEHGVQELRAHLISEGYDPSTITQKHMKQARRTMQSGIEDDEEPPDDSTP